jgi:GTP-binding protein
VQRRSIARVSKTPGRTQALNFFDILLRLQGDPLVEARSYFVDLPGYGYAAIAHEKKRAWGPELGRYVCEREALRGVLLLIDSRREPQEEEEWFQQSVQPELLLPVITKSDQLSRNELVKRRAAIAELFGKAVDEIPMVSTLHGRNSGIDELRAIIFDRVTAKAE